MAAVAPAGPTGHEGAETGSPNADAPQDMVVVILERLPPRAAVRFNQQPLQGAVIRGPRHSAGLLEVTRRGGATLRLVVSFERNQSLDLAAAFETDAAAEADDAEKGSPRGRQPAPEGKIRGPRRQTSHTPRQPAGTAQRDRAGTQEGKRPLSARPAGSIQDPWSP